MTNGFGLKTWDKIGAEMSINPTDDPKAGYKAMDDLIEEVHKESYKEFSIVADNVPVPEVEVAKTPKERQIQSTIEAINTCTTLKALEIFTKLVEREKNKELTEAFNNKKETLK